MARTADRAASDGASPKEVGRQLRHVRRKQGLSRSEVARSAGLTRRELAAYERGREQVPESDLWCLAGSCGVDVGELLPNRAPVKISSDLSLLAIGDSIRYLRNPADDDELLREYLAMIYELRNLPPGSRVPLRERDLMSLADALGGSPEMIEERLIDLIGVSRQEASRLRAMILPPRELPAPSDQIANPYEQLPTADVAQPRPEDGAVVDFFSAPRAPDPFEPPPPPPGAQQPEAPAWDATYDARPLAAPDTYDVPSVAAPDTYDVPQAAAPDTYDVPPAAPADTSPLPPVPPISYDPLPTAPADPFAAPLSPEVPAEPSPVSRPMDPMAFTVDDSDPASWTPPAVPPDTIVVDHTPDVDAWSVEPRSPEVPAESYVGEPYVAEPSVDAPPSVGLPDALVMGEPASADLLPRRQPRTDIPGLDPLLVPDPRPVAERALEPVAPIAWVAVDEPEPEAMPNGTGAPHFERAGSNWRIGGIFPATAAADDGALALRRADARWALADIDAPGDFTIEASVDFSAGPGFGVLFRASVDDSDRVSGYSFDIDPIAGGGGYLVRQWEDNRQHWRPLMQTAVTDATRLLGRHTLSVTLRSDQLTVIVDDEPVLTVPALSHTSIEFGRPPCRGNRVGVQAWATTEVTVDSFRVARY